MIDEQERFRQRIEFGIQALIHENFQILFSTELVENLPQVLHDLLEKDDQEIVLQILSKLEVASTHSKTEYRNLSVTVLSQLLEWLLNENNPLSAQVIIRILTDWIRFETEHSPTYDAVCSQLVAVGKEMLSRERYEDLEYLFLSFHHIQTGQLPKSNAIVNTIQATQEQFASDDIVDSLLKRCYSDADVPNSVARNLLTNMGPPVLDYLIDQLLISESKEHRFQLIKLITSYGKPIGKLLLNRLDKHSPWYFIRNIILMMTMIDSLSLFPKIKNLLAHEDIRVQEQVIQYIEKGGGDQTKEFLLQALFLVCDQLKIKSIMYLADMGGEDVLEVFMDLLATRSGFSEEYRDDLLMSLCIALEESTQVRAVTLLKQIIEERRLWSEKDDKVVAMAQSSLNKIEPEIRHNSKKNNVDEDEKGNDLEDDIDISFEGIDQQGDFEYKLAQHLRQGETSMAEGLLYDQAIIALEEEDYISATYFRDRMVEIGSGQLAKVIKLSNLISEKSKPGSSQSEDDLWDELKKTVNADEFKLFHDSLLLQKHENDEIIVKQGNFDPCLYFIKSGLVNLTCDCAGYETFLKRMQKGDVIGVSSFFDASFWSTSLVAHRNVHCYYLNHEHFSVVTKKFPDFEKKLHDYCVQKDQVPELLKMSGEERRQSPRFQVQDKVSITLLDRFGIVERGVFRAELVGISAGGLTCLTRIEKKAKARRLLGRMIISAINTGSGKQRKCNGVIIGVKEDKERKKHYSIHVKFDSPLSQTDVVAIVNYNKEK